MSKKNKAPPSVLGTPAQEGVDPAALGAVLKEARTGERPTPVVVATSPQQTRTELENLERDLKAKYAEVTKALDGVAKLQVHATTATVRSKYKPAKSKTGIEDGGELEEIEVRTFVTEPMRVNLTCGMTLNLGSMEFARIDVGVSVPCYEEEKDAAFDAARSWVVDRLRAQVH